MTDDDRPSCASERKGMTCAKRVHDIDRHVGIDHDGTAVWWDRSPAPAPVRVARIVPLALSAYTGDECVHCGMMVMIRTGTCATCTNCGESGGCG